MKELNETIMLVTTARNEGHWIRDWIEYHKYIGIDQALIFLHECNDNTLEILSEYPWVLPLNSSNDKRFNYDWNQLANVRKALFINQYIGAEWVIHIDVDEMIYPNNADQNSLKTALSTLADDVSQVIFPTWEVCPSLKTDKVDAYLDCLYFRKNNSIEKSFLDPDKREIRMDNNLYGHVSGKACARMREIKDAGTCHRFKILNGNNSVETGRLLHYYICSIEHWRNKFFGKFGDNTIKNSNNTRKYIWYKIINDGKLNKMEIQNYYYSYIFFSEDEVDAHAKKGNLEKFETIRDAVLVLRNNVKRPSHFKSDSKNTPGVDSVSEYVTRYGTSTCDEHGESAFCYLRKAVYASEYGTMQEAIQYAYSAGRANVGKDLSSRQRDAAMCITLLENSHRWGAMKIPFIAFVWALSGLVCKISFRPTYLLGKMLASKLKGRFNPTDANAGS